MITNTIKTAIVCIHENAYGPGHELRDYFVKQKIEHLLFISHPLLNDKANSKISSYFILYVNGKCVYKKNFAVLPLPVLLLYAKDIPLTIYWTIRYIGSADVYIGLDSLNSTAGIFLRMLKRVKRVYYYAIDYVPERSTNPVVNRIYHTVESYAATKADATWNISPRIVQAREKKWGKSFPHQMVVPHGTNIYKIKNQKSLPRRQAGEIQNPITLIYLGSLFENKGIQLVLDALPAIRKAIPDIRFVIIGKGPYEHSIRLQIHRLGLMDIVELKGYVSDSSKMRRIISQSSLGVALYKDDPNGYVRYGDPGKIKQYFSCGVPVITTDVPYIAQIIKKHACGLVVEYNAKSVSESVIQLFYNSSRLFTFKQNAFRYARNFRWDTVFSNALNNQSTPF